MSTDHARKLGTELWEFATQGMFTDVELRVKGGEAVQAHRNVLFFSPFFRILLNQPTYGQPIEQDGCAAILDLPLVPLSLCRWALSRLYTRSHDVSRDRLSDLVDLSYALQLPALTKERVLSPEDKIRKQMDGISAEGSSLPEGLWHLLKSGRFTDVEVELQGGEKTRSHVNVLAVASPVLKAMMIHPWRESSTRKITLPTVSLEVWQAVERHAYMNEADINGDNVLEVLHVADMLHMESLKQDCVALLKAALQDDNCVDILRYAKFFQLDTTFVEDYFCRHFHRICRSEFILNLDGEDFLALLRNPEVQISSEDAVCESIFFWLKNNPDVDTQLAEAFRSEVRLSDLSTEFLTEHLAKEQLYTSHDNNDAKIDVEVRRRSHLGVDHESQCEEINSGDLHDDRREELLEQSDSHMKPKSEERKNEVENDSQSLQKSHRSGAQDLERTISDSSGGFCRRDVEEHRKSDTVMIESSHPQPQSKCYTNNTDGRSVLQVESLNSPSESHMRTTPGGDITKDDHSNMDDCHSNPKLHRRGQAYSPNSYGQSDAIFVLVTQGQQLQAKAWRFSDRKWLNLPTSPVDFGPRSAAVSYHGNKVMVTGGLKKPKSAQVFCAESKIWSEVAKLPRDRMCHKMAAVGDSVFVLGGACHGRPVMEVDAYSETTKVWSCRGSLAVGVYGVAVATLGDKIIVAGSNNGKEVLQAFDTRTNTCSVLTNGEPSLGFLRYQGASIGTSAWFLCGHGSLIQVTEGETDGPEVKRHGHVEDFRYDRTSEVVVHSNGSLLLLGNSDDEKEGRSLQATNIRPLGPRCVSTDDDVMPLPADVVLQAACRLLVPREAQL